MKAAEVRQGTHEAQSRSDINRWNEIAPIYEKMEPNEYVYPAIKEVFWATLGEVNSLTVLDIGCGHGWLSHIIAEEGANVIGIDGSTELLRYARSRFPNLLFYEQDLVIPLQANLPAIDLAVAYMVLMNIPDIVPLVTSLHPLLRANGRFVIVLPHPAFFHTTVDQNTKDGPFYRKVEGYLREEVWLYDKFGGHNHYHRSISYYTEALRIQGFVITRLSEPKCIPWQTEPARQQSFYDGFPAALLIEARKAG
jgi:SAM-dependent methyltransferase